MRKRVVPVSCGGVIYGRGGTFTLVLLYASSRSCLSKKIQNVEKSVFFFFFFSYNITPQLANFIRVSPLLIESHCRISKWRHWRTVFFILSQNKTDQVLWRPDAPPPPIYEDLSTFIRALFFINIKISFLFISKILHLSNKKKKKQMVLSLNTLLIVCANFMAIIFYTTVVWWNPQLCLWPNSWWCSGIIDKLLKFQVHL